MIGRTRQGVRGGMGLGGGIRTGYVGGLLSVIIKETFVLSGVLIFSRLGWFSSIAIFDTGNKRPPRPARIFASFVRSLLPPVPHSALLSLFLFIFLLLLLLFRFANILHKRLTSIPLHFHQLLPPLQLHRLRLKFCREGEESLIVHPQPAQLPRYSS